MSQTPYTALSHGPVVQMDNYGYQQRIKAPPQPWWTPRRTKVIVAIVILSILFILVLCAYFKAFSATNKGLSRQISYDYST